MRIENKQHRTRPVTVLFLAGALLAPSIAGAQQGPRAEPEWPSTIPEQPYGQLLIDRLEYAAGDNDEDTLNWEALGYYGGDYQRVWLDTEGEDVVSGGDGGEIESADVLYGRLIAPFWDLEAGVGYQRQYGPGDDRDRFSGVFGVRGLAPYWFELEAFARASEDGDVSAELEAEYQLLLSQRLILSPRFTTSVAAQEVEEFGVGEGFNDVQLGLRLRYEIRREFAPYVGVSWSRKLGDTADLAEAEGEDRERASVLAGVRMWF